MKNPYPHELSLGDVYFSPALAVVGASLIATWLTVSALNKLRWSRFVRYPTATFLAIMAFYILTFDRWFIRI